MDAGCAGARWVAAGMLLSVSMAVQDTPDMWQALLQRLVVLQLFQCRQGWLPNSDLAPCPRALCKQANRKQFSAAVAGELASAVADTWSCLWGAST